MRIVAHEPAERAANWTRLEASSRLDPVAALRVALVLLCVSNIVRIPVGGTSVHSAAIDLGDLLVGAVAALAFVPALRTRSLILDDVTLTGLLFAGLGALSALLAVPRFDLDGLEVVISLAYLGRWMMYFTLYAVVINFVRDRNIARVWDALETGMLLFSAFGIFQSVFIPNFAQRLYPDARLYFDYDPQGHRLVSTALDPNLAAAMILIPLLVHIGILSAGGRIAWWKTTMFFTALVLTLSRGAALSLIVGVVVIIAARGVSRRVLRFALLGSVVLLALLPRILDLAARYSRLTISDASAATRVIGWGRAIEVFLEHPIIGIGFNTYGFVQERRGISAVGVASYSVEGGLLFVMVMTGVLGAALYTFMMWRVVRRARRTWRLESATPEQRGFLIGVAAMTVAIVVSSLFVNSLLTPFVMLPMVVTWGLAFAVANQVRLQSGAS